MQINHPIPTMYRILCVDDEPDLLDLLKIFLEESGQFSVDTITSATEALVLLDSEKYDAIISDYQMPDVDGIELLKEIRKRFGDIPFILFTGRGREEVVIEAINNWADFYLQKGGGTKAGFTDIAHKIIVAVERRQVLEAIGRNENDFESLVECAPDAIYIGDGDRFLYANAAFARMLGAASPKQITGMSIYDRIHPDYHALIHGRANLVHIDKKPSGLKDVVYLKIDGTPIDVESSAAPFRFRGQPAALVILRDIRVRKRAEKELQKIYGELEKRVIERTLELSQTQEAYRKANGKLNLLSGITRHDINNQMMVLQSYLILLKKKLPDPSLSKYFQEITNAAERISAMIRFTKEYESIGVNAPVWQDCRTLIETATKEALAGKIPVRTDIPVNTEIFADPLIVKVFYNLMDNAARYGGKITGIHFSVQESGHDYLILCEDDGDGIPVELKDKIFDRGFGKNTGLGLFLSREILSITGITIRETGEYTTGARFEITVPEEGFRIARSPKEPI